MTTTAADSNDTELVELLTSAIEETANRRNALIAQLRYALIDGSPRTLQVVGDEVGLTRERVRQLAERVVRGIYRRALEGHAGPSSSLVSRLEVIRPGELGASERCYRLALDEFASLPLHLSAPLLFSLVGVRGNSRKRLVAATLSFAEHERERERTERQQRRRQQAFLDHLVRGAFWPSQHRLLSASPGGAKRLAENGSHGECGVFESVKLGRAVEYESELERELLMQLDDHPAVAWLQEQPLALEYELDGTPRVYYPDVLIGLHDGRVIVCEVKPRFQMGLHANLVKWRAALRFCRRHGYGLLITDGRTSLPDLLARPVPFPFREGMLAALQDGPLTWPGCLTVRHATGAMSLDLVALIVQERLICRLRPFRVSLAA